jgi:hypothetical protein
VVFALDEVGYCALNSVHNTLARLGRRETLLFLLAVLNSRLLSYYYRQVSQETRVLFPQVHIAELRRLPIRLPADGGAVLAALAARMVAQRRHPDGTPTGAAAGKEAAAGEAGALEAAIEPG